MLLDAFAGLDPETRLLGETVRAFAREVVAPGAIERDETERFDRGLVVRMAELGLLAGPFPEAAGGAGLSSLAWTVVVEEIAAADMALAVTLCVHVLHQNPVVRWGTAEQKGRWLPALQAGEALGAFALTEPEAGSNAAAIRMRAERVGPADAPEGYRLTGTKVWISNAPEAERYLVFATMDPRPRPGGRSRPSSWRRGRRASASAPTRRRWGSAAARPRSWSSRSAEVPVANRLGGEGEGYRVALSALGDGRIGIAAACTGLARSALEQAAAYLGERTAYGAPIAELQGLRFMIAEMAQQVAAARALTREAAAACDRGAGAADVAAAASLAKWTASDAAMRVATDAVQLFGGAGYSRETGVERLMRDAKGAQIYEGTNQVHRGIVADAVLGRVGG